MASSSESLSGSSLTGRAVTLPKKGLEADVGFGLCECSAPEAPASAKATRMAGTARRRPDCCARITLTILSDERRGAGPAAFRYAALS